MSQLVLPMSIEIDRERNNERLMGNILKTAENECQNCHTKGVGLTPKDCMVFGFDRMMFRRLQLCARCFFTVQEADHLIIQGEAS